PNEQDHITISADFGDDWNVEKPSSHVWLLRGRVRITQGDTSLAAQSAVIWISREKRQGMRQKLQIYLERDVVWKDANRNTSEDTLLHELTTHSEPDFTIRKPRRTEATLPLSEDQLYLHALARRDATRKTPAQPAEPIDINAGDVGTNSKRSPSQLS